MGRYQEPHLWPRFNPPSPLRPVSRLQLHYPHLHPLTAPTPSPSHYNYSCFLNSPISNLRFCHQHSSLHATSSPRGVNRLPTNISAQRSTPPPRMSSDPSPQGAHQPSLSSRPSASSLRSVPPPPSPRSPSRHASISHTAMADLLSTPPLPKQDGAIPRDWRSVSAGELVEGQVLRFVELDTPVESACQVWLTLTPNF